MVQCSLIGLIMLFILFLLGNQAFESYIPAIMMKINSNSYWGYQHCWFLPYSVVAKIIQQYLAIVHHILCHKFYSFDHMFFQAQGNGGGELCSLWGQMLLSTLESTAYEYLQRCFAFWDKQMLSRPKDKLLCFTPSGEKQIAYIFFLQ